MVLYTFFCQRPSPCFGPFVVFCLICISVHFAVASDATGSAWRAEFFPAVGYFQWQEKALGLKESGPLYGAGLETFWTSARPVAFSANASLFGGEVNYDGSKMDQTPYTSKTLYLGVKGEGHLFYPLPLHPRVTLAPDAGVGVRWWKRRLDNTDEKTAGYDEHWLALYAAAGARCDAQINPELTLRLCAFVRYPFYNQETVYMNVDKNTSSFTLEPGRDWSVYLESHLQFKQYFLKLFYEQLRFQASAVNSYGFYQPDSEGDYVALAVGAQL